MSKRTDLNPFHGKTESARQLLDMIKETILEAVRESGDTGVPSGTIYAALMGLGISLDSYNAILNLLIEEKKIIVKNHVLYSAPQQRPVPRSFKS